MKAIEATGEIDKEGTLHLDHPLSVRDTKVKVIILMSEDEEAEEKQWLAAMSNNPAFNFLHDEQEDVYSSTDGKPFHD